AQPVSMRGIIACAAGGRGDPCTQCESEKRKVARGALLCSQGRWLDDVRKRCAVRFSSIRVRVAHDQLTPSRAGRGTRRAEGSRGVRCNSIPYVVVWEAP